MRLAAQDHGWNKDRILGDLAGLVGGTSMTPQVDAPVYFRSIRLGLEDIAMAYGIWHMAYGNWPKRPAKGKHNEDQTLWR